MCIYFTRDTREESFRDSRSSSSRSNELSRDYSRTRKRNLHDKWETRRMRRKEYSPPMHRKRDGDVPRSVIILLMGGSKGGRQVQDAHDISDDSKRASGSIPRPTNGNLTPTTARYSSDPLTVDANARPALYFLLSPRRGDIRTPPPRCHLSRSLEHTFVRLPPHVYGKGTMHQLPPVRRI